MPNYHPNAKSIVHGLSDFWTMYFRELPLLEEMYRAVEIDVGQTYLDLMSLVLNNSLQDTTIFNKEFFKLLRLREDVITYSEDGTYTSAVGADVAGLKYLNNRVFEVTSSLERGVDFSFNDATRCLEFPYDPFSAYFRATVGEGTSEFTVTSRVPGEGERLRLSLVDDGTYPATVTRNDYSLSSDGYVLTIFYDGPSSTGRSTSAELVSLLNTDLATGSLVRAALTGTGTGTGTPAAGEYVFLQLSTSPISSFASRSFDVKFGTKFTDLQYDNLRPWQGAGVRKGDALRILPSPGFGAPAEFRISLVRDSALYLYDQVAATSLPAGLDYAVLRSPGNDQVLHEPFMNTGVDFGSFATLSVNGAASQLLEASITLSFAVFLDDIIELNTAQNAGQYRIVGVEPGVITVEGPPLVDEAAATPSLWTGFSAGGFAGALSASVDGFANFSAPSTFSPSHVGGVLRRVISGTEWVYYDIVAYVNSSNITVATPVAVPAPVVCDFLVLKPVATANYVDYAFPKGVLLPNTVQVQARRAIDGAAVLEGRDYTVDIDAGAIRPKTVWQTSITNRINYRYRKVVASTAASLEAGTAGTITAGSPATFADPSATFTDKHVGSCLQISSVTNAGKYIVSRVVDVNTVELGADWNPTLPDGDNGSLVWALFARGGADVVATTTPVTELGVWAVDAQVDRYHLYFTYGYLISRFEPSSENYRALIRGLFQLFMLGPTLERFEAAINTVAALAVIRDDDELLLSYDSGADRAGTDGVFDAALSTFSSATASFVPADLSAQIFITAGANTGRLYTIQAILSPTTVQLFEVPSSAVGASWEITTTGEHSITTSRAVYSYPRTVPLKAKYLDSANWGVLALQAFTVVTAAFEVTDYVETPYWWESVRIPEVLIPSMTPERRKASPALFENTFPPADAAHFGDPGFFIGGDDEGNPAARYVLRSGTGDATLSSDPLLPISSSGAYADIPSGAFTLADVGNILRLDYPAVGTEYRVTALVSATRVNVEMFIPIDPAVAAGLDWELVTGTVPLRHNVAYVIVDKFLKQHLFSVRFDAFLLSQLASSVMQDLQDLVFTAKPTYTYLVLTPSLLFDEVVRMQEANFDVQATLIPGGSAGMQIAANLNELTFNPTWNLGAWFRNVEETNTFSVPAATATNIAGSPRVGFQRYAQKVFLDPLTYTLAGVPLPHSKLAGSLFAIETGGTLLVTGGEVIFDNGGVFDFTAAAVLQYIVFPSPSNPSNAGGFRIGAVLSPTQVRLYAPAAVAETALAWFGAATGAINGQTYSDSEGRSFFKDSSGLVIFNTGHVGNFIRRPYTGSAGQEVWRVGAYVADDTVELYQEFPVTYGGFLDVTLSGTTATVVNPGEFIPLPGMMYVNRRTADAPTARKIEYFLRVESGPDSGQVRRFLRYIDPVTWQVEGAAFTGGAATCSIFYIEHYNILPEGGMWTIFVPAIYTANDDPLHVPDELVLLDGLGADANSVAFTTYGVEEPLDPAAAAYDATAGDTYYFFGMSDPRQNHGNGRSGLDMDLREEPVMIIRVEEDLGLLGSYLELELG